MASLYPGWRMRIYHNVTSAQPATLASLCSLYCGHQHVDMCDMIPQHSVSCGEVREVPGECRQQNGGCKASYVQVLGDATVRRFLVRDTDAWLLPRERAAVTQWEESGAMQCST